jgi:hypothetical protein
VTPLTAVLVTEWALTGIGACVFLLFYGWPSRYSDKTMAWHIASVTALTALEAFGLLLVGLGIQIPLWPFALIYGVATAIVYWRVWLLVKAPRRRVP